MTRQKIVVKCRTGGQYEILSDCPSASVVWRNHLGQMHTIHHASGTCLPAFQSVDQFRQFLRNIPAYAGRM